jgi:DNA-binding PucR family transcriptional regulator
MTQDLGRSLLAALPSGSVASLGAPAPGLSGWRLTHRQAAAARAVAHLSGSRCATYVDIALEAALLRDDVLRDSVRQLYLEPLDCDRELLETVRAYLAAGMNAASAASALGISRRTVSNRLRLIEERIGLELGRVYPELALAARLRDLPPGRLP